MPQRPQHEHADGNESRHSKDLDEACQGSQGSAARGKPWQEGQRNPPSDARQHDFAIDHGNGHERVQGAQQEGAASGEPQLASKELATA
jgi:hypothetical protein